MAVKQVNEEFHIKVGVEDVVGMVALSVWISYDPEIVEVVDTNASALGTQVDAEDLGFLPNATLLANVKSDGVVEEPGTLIVGYTSIPSTPTDGSGDCFQVLFKAKSAGETSIEFVTDQRFLFGEDGAELDAEWNDDSVTVEGVVSTAVVNLTVV